MGPQRLEACKDGFTKINLKVWKDEPRKLGKREKCTYRPHKAGRQLCFQTGKAGLSYMAILNVDIFSLDQN